MPLNNGHSSKVRGLMEQKAQELSSTLTQFIDTQLFTSALLLVSILLAVFACNIDAVSGTYKNIINTPFGFHLDGYLFSMTLHQFVNDFLLTIFFFVLGLEIKREFVIGELSEVSKSLYVILCAVGGALLPVAFYTLLNFNNPQTFHGWAIPMATDTALAIGVLHLFKRLVAKKAFTLIASLAVIDDILSIVIIAAFYTGHFSLTLFLLAMIVLLVLVIFNLSGFRHPLIYIIFGFILWVCIENAGVHGTIAGVLVAMCIPARPKKKPSAAVKNIRQLLNKFENEYDDGKHLLEDEKPHELLEGVTDVSLEATTPLKRWENRLELPVLLFILPLFALTNGGFNIDFAHLSQTITSSVFLGNIFRVSCGEATRYFSHFMSCAKTWYS
jgi:NhaA family Na+:H+ antiporter